jgi:predicted nucleic acid-binding protein
MKVGVDTSVIIAAVHANHPMHGPAAQWLDSALDVHDLFVAHHSVLEAYAVLTRLPSKYRLSAGEADAVLRGTLEGNVAIAPFIAASIWKTLGAIVAAPAAGGAAYDAFIVQVLRNAGVEVIATYNVEDFRRVESGVRVASPSDF